MEYHENLKIYITQKTDEIAVCIYSFEVAYFKPIFDTLARKRCHLVVTFAKS